MLPRELEPENVGDVAARVPGGLRDPGFEDLMRRIDEGPIHPGNRVEIYFNGDRAAEAVREAVANARTEVLVEAYILRDDETGRSLFEQLKKAVARGASVRVLADALGSMSTRAEFWREMRDHGLEVRLFHPLSIQIWLQFFRDHRKILVVDRETAFIGGMNVANEYGSSIHAKGRTWRDTHARLEGPSAWELAVVFSEAWNRAGSPPFELPPLDVQERDGARALVLDSRPGRGHVETASVLAAIVGAAREYLFITNAYFAPRMRAVRILADAVRRGVDVRLLLPGVSDVPLVRHASHAYYPKLLAHDVRVFEYQKAPLHAKSLVADDYVTVVGSSNLDALSFQNNAECNVVVLDEPTARNMAAAYAEDMAHSVEIRADTWHRSLLHQWGDSGARCLRPIL